MFSTPIAHPSAERRLFDGASLVLGGRRRATVDANGTIVDATDVAEEDLVDAQPLSGGVRFVGHEGGVFFATAPLAPLRLLGRAPLVAGKRWFVAGSSAILAVSEHGTVHRTEDGKTFTSLDLGLRGDERVIDAAADARGVVLVLVIPQRAVVSFDDGRSFRQVATPGVGAAAAKRDSAGKLWLEGASGPAATLSIDDQRFNSDGAFAPSRMPVTKQQRKYGRWLVHAGWTLAGGEVIDVRRYGDDTAYQAANHSSKTLRIGLSARHADGTFGPELLTDVARSGQQQVWSMGVGGHPWMAMVDRIAGSMRVVEPTIDGWAVPLEREGRIWSRGLLASGDLLVVGASHGAASTPPQIQFGGAWFPLRTETADIEPEDVAYDPARAVVYLLGSTNSGEPALFAAHTPFPTTFERLPFNPVEYASFPSIPIDTNGTLRLIGGPTSGAKIQTRAPDGSSSLLRVPFEKARIDLAGARGVAVDDNGAWETADGGQHWTHIAAPSADFVTCAARGCLLSESGYPRSADALRTGWALPEGHATGMTPDAIAAAAPVVTETEYVSPPTAQRWSCKIGKQVAKLPGFYEMDRIDAPGADVAWAALGADEQLTVHPRGTAPKSVALLAPVAPNLWRVHSQDVSNEHGVAVARWTLPRSRAAAEWDPEIEVAWYRFATKKVHHARVKERVRVGSFWSDPAIVALTSNGLFFMPRSGAAPAHFFSDDGSDTTIPPVSLPDWHEQPQAAQTKDGSLWLLARSLPGGISHSTIAHFDANSWTTRTWGLSELPTMHELNGEPTLLWPGSGPERLSLPLPVDPPYRAKKKDTNTMPPICSAAKRNGVRSRLPLGTEARVGAPDGILVRSDDVVTVTDSEGNTCLESARLGGEGHAAFIAFDDPQHATLLSAHKDETLVHELACKPQ